MRILIALLLALWPALAFAHGVTGSDQVLLEPDTGAQVPSYACLRARRMVTGYDHPHLSQHAGVESHQHPVLIDALHTRWPGRD